MRRHVSAICATAAALFIASGAHAQRIGVTVDGEEVYFRGAGPVERGGRVLVPLRGVLEKMGAHVEWRANTQTVAAMKADTELILPIGSRWATVNGQRMALDVPAMMVYGRTMVPLRFVSEALGAEVEWMPANRLVAISTDMMGDGVARRAPIVRRAHRNTNTRVVLPVGTVIPVTLDTHLSSKESRSGDRFTATITGENAGGLPDGTRFEGVVREAIASRDNRPGVLDVDFVRVILPDGTTRAINAGVGSLDKDDVTTTASGRLQSRKSGRSDERLKWVGIGAGAGLLVSTLTKGNALVDTLLGAGAGYLYGELQRKGAGDVTLREGTRVGVQLGSRFAVVSTDDGNR